MLMEPMGLIRLSAAPMDCKTFDGPTGASGADHKLPLACLKAAELVVVASGEPGWLHASRRLHVRHGCAFLAIKWRDEETHRSDDM